MHKKRVSLAKGFSGLLNEIFNLRCSGEGFMEDAAVPSQALSLIQETIELLSEQERKIIESRYGLKKGLEPATFKQIGVQLKLSGARISQIHKKTLRWFRHPDQSAAIDEMIFPRN